MAGITMCHHQYVSNIYLDKPGRPLYVHVEELEREFGLIVRFSLMER